MTTAIPVFNAQELLPSPEINVFKAAVDLSSADSTDAGNQVCLEAKITNGTSPQIGSVRVTIKYAFCMTNVANLSDVLPHCGIMEVVVPNAANGVIYATTPPITIRGKYMHVWIEHEKFLSNSNAYLDLSAVIVATPGATRDIVGVIELEGFIGTGTTTPHARLVTFKATNAGGAVIKTWAVTVINGSGNKFVYRLDAAPALTTGISAKTAWSLRRKQAIAPALGLNTLNFTGTENLLAGDVDDDNLVNAADIALITAAVGGPLDAAMDINGDGANTTTDVALATANNLVAGDAE